MRKVRSSRQPEPPRKNLYLVGFMGTGKSYLGRALARDLGLRFIDADHAIEKAHGANIPTIFAEHGEAYFRQLEKDFVESGHPAQDCVVACGGGMITQPGILEMLQEKGVVVALFASVDTILRRTSGNKRRPLLNVENPRERITTLLQEREPFYRKVPLAVVTDGRSGLSLKARVRRLYESHL